MAQAALAPVSGANPPTRSAIQRASLEIAITTAVKQAGAGCKSFVGVIVEHVARDSKDETNWALKGVKFGNAEREKCSSALAVIVDRLKKEFEIDDKRRS